MASTNFAYFYWYSVVRALYLSSALSSSLQPKAPNAVTELSLGAVAGALAQILTIPLSVVTTRQQTQARGGKKGLLDTGREVVNGEDGWTGLWRGLKASLVLVVNPAITYGAYERLREVLFPGKRSLRPWEAFSKNSRLFLAFCLLTEFSSRGDVQGRRHHRHTASYRRQGGPAVTTSTCQAWQALQKRC